MAKGSLRLILPVFAALGVACGGDGGIEPGSHPGPRVLTRLEVTPTEFLLNTVAPGNTLQLTIRAYDQAGAPLLSGGAVTYTSSAPAIAAVTSSGVVTATAPGTAEITTALTLGGTTKTASTTVTVYTLDYSDNTGVYDLTAVITTFDPAWGEDLAGYRYTAVLTLHDEWDAPWFAGTYSDLRLIGPSGDSTAVADSGIVTASFDRRGRLVVELVDDRNHLGLSLIVATLTPGFMDGDFGCCGHISGRFSATRRPR